MHTRFVRFAAGLAALATLIYATACGSGDNSPTGGGGLSKIVLTPAVDTVQIGDVITITAAPQTANGSPVPGLTLFWSSSNEGVATVNQSGQVTTISPGTASIAASANGVSGQMTLVVTPKNVASITIAPASASLYINQSVQLSATLKDSSGNVLTGRTVSWSSGTSSVASVDQSGFVLALAVGTTTISATSGGATGTATITVSNVPVASITISPPAPTVIVGQTTQLSATLKDANGNVLTGRVVAWSSASTGIATINPTNGLVTGVAAGTSVITATSGTVSAQVTVTVNTPPASSVVISPSVANVYVGGTVQLTAVVTDANGNPITGAQVTYTSSTAGVATVTSGGLVTGVAPGTALITGKSGTATGAAAVNVTLVPVKTITITPSPDTVLAGATSQLTATAYDSAGNVLTGRPITWTSGNSSQATVSATGLVNTAPSVTITANRTVSIFAASGSAQGVGSVVIRAAGIASVTVSPAADTILQGGTKQLTATVVDSNGNTVTRTISWTSANSSIAAVSGTGLVTGGADTGTTTITATVGTVSGTNSTYVTQTATTGVSVSLSPSNDTLVVAATGGQANATTTPAGRTVTWSSSNTAVATINASSGAITAVGPGQTTITGTAGSATGAVTLTVVLGSVTVSPNPVNAQVGGAAAAVTATGLDANGNTVAGVTFTWSTASNAVATVVSTGATTANVTGVAAGSTTLTATGGGRASAAIPVNVTAAAPASVTIAPTPDTIFGTAPKNTVTLTATVRDANNNVLTGVPLTWSSSAASASVSNGVVTGTGSPPAGPTTITATTGNNISGTATVLVVGHVGTVVLSPAAGATTLSYAGIVDPTSTPVTATVLDTYGNNVTTTETVTWTSSDPTNAPITVNGVAPSGAIPASTAVTVTAAGLVTETVTITATATDGGVVGTTTINIIP
jgi:trimeric autotransporter adhesin